MVTPDGKSQKKKNISNLESMRVGDDAPVFLQLHPGIRYAVHATLELAAAM